MEAFLVSRSCEEASLSCREYFGPWRVRLIINITKSEINAFPAASRVREIRPISAARSHLLELSVQRLREPVHLRAVQAPARALPVTAQCDIFSDFRSALVSGAGPAKAGGEVPAAAMQLPPG